MSPTSGMAPTWTRWVWLPLLIAALFLAYLCRFTQDDAFISFVYVENLAQGRGLVWSTGERIEGYSNFLFVILLAGLRVAGIAPEQAAPLVGLASFAAALLLARRVATRLSRDAIAGPIAMVLLGTNFTFLSYATGGLETSLTIALILGCVVVAQELAGQPERASLGKAVGFGVLGALALMSRLDSALFVAPLGLVAAWALIREGGRWRAVAAMLVSGMALLVPWFAWKWSYYGDLLPNTYYAKRGDAGLLLFGALYFYMFWLSYLGTPLIWAYAAARQARRERSRPITIALLAASLLWVVHCLRVGGDTLEFRFVVPLIAVGSILTASVCATMPRRVAGLLVAALVVGSLHHAMTFGTTTKSRFISPTHDLEGALYGGNGNRVGVGKGLAALFHRPEAPDPVRIAVMPAGAIPYHSRLPSLDLLGLNDRWVARHGEHHTRFPGHLRVAPKSYVESREVNLYIGPALVDCPSRAPHRFMIGRVLQDFGERVTPPPPTTDDVFDRLSVFGPVLAIPVEDGCTLHAAYMKPHPLIEEHLAASRIRYLRPPT